VIFVEKVGEVETERTNSASYNGLRRSYLCPEDFAYLSSEVLIESNLHSPKKFIRAEHFGRQCWDKRPEQGLE
jgi:hypothetical protein